MKKSNWIIVGILVVASIIFLWLYYTLGFDLVHQLDLILTIIWWVLIIGICVAIHMVETRRCRAIRTSFLAKDVIYNPEAGIVRVPEGENIITKLEDVLKHLDYDVKSPSSPNDKRIRFDYIVHSDKFALNRGVWEGDVVDVAHNNRSLPFSGKQELELIVGVPIG